MFLRLIIIYIIFSIFLTSCANQTPPSGGPKDTIRPVLKSSHPKQGEINFRGKTLEFTFSERIMTQNLTEQLLITPYTEINYKPILRKNKLLLEFEKELPENFTYTFNFRDGLKDETEGNTANLSLSFSTGSFLDSLTIAGTVRDLMTDKPLENILISVYPTSDTFPASSGKPLYFTRSKKDGSYHISNIKNDIYDLFAIQDDNKNLLYNQKEKLAYIKNINLTQKSSNNLTSKLSRFDSAPPEISNVKENSETIELQLSEGIEKVEFKNTDYNFYPTIIEKGKKVLLFKTGPLKDTLRAQIQLSDSANHTATEETKLLFAKKKDETEEPFRFSTNPSSNGEVTPNFPEIILTFNKPVTKINYNKIKVKDDTVTNLIKKESVHQQDPLTIKLNFESKAKDSLFLILDKGAFSTLDSTTPETKTQFKLKKEENFALMEVTIKTSQESYVIELLNDKYEPLIKFSDLKKFTYTFLNPGTYYLRAIIDTNKNGKWDPGDLKTGQLPEDIIVFKNKIDLRANWEVRDVNFSF